ncbi:MAG: MlaD family protein [Bradymonadaceae bacterium]
MDLESIFTPFKVGLVVLAGIVASLYMVTMLTRGDAWSTQGGYEVHAMFDDVTGLAKNSRVRMSGIPIGTVDSIELEGDKVRVTVQITNDDVELHQGIEQPDGYYKNGATIQKTQASMIGDYFLKITPGTEGPVLEDGGEIENVTKTIGPSELFTKFDSIASDIKEITSSLSAVLGTAEGRKGMKEILENLRVLVDTLRGFVEENSQKIDRILDNARGISRDMRRLTRKGSESIETMLADAESIVQEVKLMVGESSSDVQAGLGTLRGTLGRLQSTLDSLNYSLQNVQDITDKVNEGEGTLGKLVNDDDIAKKTEEILTDVENLTNRYDRLKAIVNLRTEYHLRHRRIKNVLGLRLQPGPKKFYLAEFVDDYRGKQTVVRKDVNTTRGDVKDGTYRTTTVKTTNDFKFSFQLGRNLKVTDWFTLSGRFGLIESSGGLGANLLFLKNQQLDVQLDAFDFGTAANPRIRSFVTYDILEFAYVAGGVDDILNERRRDYFLGGGIEFNDQDLKALLTATGAPSTQ